MKDTPIQTTAADLLIDCLEANGVTRAFGVPGEETTALMAALDRSGIDFILCRHEQSAAFMASVHGRLTGQPALCLATLGPGATNLVTGVADATLDHVPLIALTGQGARARLSKESHQIIDLEALFAPVTKQSRSLAVAEEIPQAVADAVRLSTADKPGAVHLSLPEDLAKKPTDARPFAAPPLPEIRADANAVARAARRLASAETPLIVAGHGAIRAQAAEAVKTLAEHISAPVLTTFMAKGILPPDHRLNLQAIGQPRDDIADEALRRADLILAIGFDPVEYPAEALTRGGLVPVLDVAETMAEADPAWPVKAALLGDVTASLAALQDATASRTPHGRFDDLRSRLRADLSRSATAPEAPRAAPQDICRVLTDLLRPQDLLLSGVGLHKLWIARNVLPPRAGQVIIPNGLAGMGLALPGAIEAARHVGDGRVLAVCGDGDFLMNLQEMETAVRHCLPVTVLIWEDGGYGLIDEKQTGADDFAFGNPDWRSLAQAFGWVYCDIARFDQLAPALTNGADSAMPTLLRISVDYAAGGGMPGEDS